MMTKSPLAVSVSGLLLALTAAQQALPIPDPDDGAIALPPGFRALVVADNLIVNRKARNSAERLRGLAVAPSGDIYGKG